MSAILTNRSAGDRPATDFYPTPANVTTALVRWLESEELLRPVHRIWEPASGQGHMVRALAAQGYDVTGTDLFNEPAHDFLDTALAQPQADWIITNPPFVAAAEFIERAASIGKPFALLLKAQYWHAARRADLFLRHRPAAVLPLTWRPDFLMGSKGGAPTMDVAWTVWTPAAQTTQYVPLRRPAPEEVE